MRIDLHTHTTASDGRLSPKELIDAALKERLDVIGITDHDTTAGIAAAQKAAKNTTLTVVPGIEITADHPQHSDIHILGLFIDPNHKDILDIVDKAQKARIVQKKDMIQALQKLGYKITYEEVHKLAKGTIGRPHIASILMKNNKQLETPDQVFDTLIGNGQPAYKNRKQTTTFKQAIDAIHNARGLAILAHPLVYSNTDAKTLIHDFKKAGGDAIEHFYPYRADAFEKYSASTIKKEAEKLNLLLSGGSDFHGRDATLASQLLPEENYKKLKNQAD